MTKYRLVPVEPTEEMLDAIRFRVGSIDRDEADEIYYLILSSSPDVQGEPEPDVAMLLGLLDDCLNSMRNAYPDYDHYETNAYISATAALSAYRKGGCK